MRAHCFWPQPTYVNLNLGVFFCIFFVAFLFLIFFLKNYDEIGKNRGYLALGMGPNLPNFGPAEQAKNALGGRITFNSK